MLLGAHLAGAAIENSMLGATHALANPLSAHFDLTHGVAIGVLLPHVVRYNSDVDEIRRLYGILAHDAELCDEDDPEAGHQLARRIEDLVRVSGQPANLNQCGVDPQLLGEMAAEASRQWTGQFNPRTVDVSSLAELYRCAFNESSTFPC